MSQTRRILLGVGFMALGFLVIGMVARHSRSRSALARYKAELLAKGEKLTLAMLTSGRATNANTSQALVTNAAAKLGLLKSQPGYLDLRKYVAPGQAQVIWMQDRPGWNVGRGSPSPVSWDQLASDVEAARETLEEIRQALKDPAPDAGTWSSNVFERRINFVAIRSAAQWLAGAALVALRQGDSEEALQNLEALAALARMNRDEITLVGQMIRVAIANMGLTATWEALAAPDWTEPQLERLQKAWEGVDLLDALEKGFLGERAGGMELFRLVLNNSGRNVFSKIGWQSSGAPNWRTRLETLFRDDVAYPAYRFTSADDDELFYLQTMQGSLTGIRLLKAHAPWSDAKRCGDDALARLNRLTNAFDGFRYWFSLMSIPNFSRAMSTAVRGETERQMTITVIALKRYAQRYGKLPGNLKALVPEFMSKAPKDPMSGQPLDYRLHADGTFVLYSTGEDGADDGGDPTPMAGRAPGLWEGRDAVWPKPATRAAASQ